MATLTAEELYNLFKESVNASFIVTQRNIYERLEITSDKFNCKSAEFYNVTFHERVKFNDIKVTTFLHFSYCTFEKGVEFDSCELAEANPTLIMPSLSFTKCKIAVILNIYNSSFEHGISLSHCTNIGQISLVNVYSSKGQLYLDALQDSKSNASGEVILKHGVDSICLKGCDFSGGYLMCGCRVKDSVDLFNVKGISFSVKDSLFYSKFYVWDSVFTKTFIFNDVEFEGEVFFEVVRSRTLGLFRTKCLRTFKVESVGGENENRFFGGFRQLELNDFYSKEGFYINHFKDYGSYCVETEFIDINFTMIQAPDIVFGNLNIYELRLYGINNNNKVSFKNLQVSRLLLENLTNNSQIFFSNCRSSTSFVNVGDEIQYGLSVFRINDSFLGNTQFLDFDMADFITVEIGSSIISEIATANVKWFARDSLKIVQNSIPFNEISILEKKIEIYRQLKLAMNEHHNRRQALIFQSYEYDYYRKLLNHKEYTAKNKFWDRISLGAGWINDFGQNWAKALLIMILVVGPINIVIICLAETSPIEVSEVSSYGIREFVMLLNPVHILNEVFDNRKYEINSFLYILDFMQRILVGFFIVQIVSAFRKYFKN